MGLDNSGKGGKLTTTMRTKTETQTFKIRKTTLGKLRLIYALTGKTMISILDYLISAELERIQPSADKAERKNINDD